MPIAIDEATQLQLRRHYAVPPAVVYAAWTQPEQLSHWMAPSDGFAPTVATVDLRVGGHYELRMRDPGGEEHVVRGVFREVTANRKLVYTWAWQSTPERESLVTLELLSSGGGTDLVLTHARLADAEARDKHAQGWNGCLERLGRFVAQ